MQCLAGVQLHQAKLRQNPLQGIGEEQLVLGAGVTVGLFIPEIVQVQLLCSYLTSSALHSNGSNTEW